jgi:broad specificity phosphatase PhoE
MSIFYFVRHGQTDANVAGLMCGSKWDIDLNSVGVEQARLAGEILKSYSFQSIAVSPLIRARKTAEAISSHQGIQPVVVDELAEWDIGSWDRLPFETVKEEFLGTGEPVGGESRLVFKTRIESALEKCRAFESPLLIVAHGAVWLILQEILGIPPTRVENGIPFKIFLDKNEKWQAIRIDYST